MDRLKGIEANLVIKAKVNLLTNHWISIITKILTMNKIKRIYSEC